MSHLEHAWESLPVGEPPVGAIVAAARGLERARRRRRMVVGGSLAAASVLAAGLVLTGLPSVGLIDTAPVAFQADLKPAQSCDELLKSYQDRALPLVGPGGWQGQGPIPYATSGPIVADDMAVPHAPAPQSAEIFRTSKGIESQRSSATGTNTQEAGVDEPDTVKTNGTLLVRLRENQLIVYSVAGKTVDHVGDIRVDDVDNGELLLQGTTAVVLGADSLSPHDDYSGGFRGTRVVSVSLADPAHPEINSAVTYGSRLLAARLTGGAVRLVLSSGLPDLHFGDSDRRNRDKVRNSGIDDWLPTYTVDGDTNRLVDCGEAAVPPGPVGLDTVSVVSFAADDATDPHAVALAGPTDIAYASADHIYLAASAPGAWSCTYCVEDRQMSQLEMKQQGTSYLYEFGWQGLDAIHEASGEVEGTIADRWSIDDAGNALRVIVGASSETGPFNSIVTLRRSGDMLHEIGRLDHLGHGTDLAGVRWFDTVAMVEMQDAKSALIAVDLSDPTLPRRIGTMRVPGFSDYFHPIGRDQLLGLGQSNWKGAGAQIGLFDAKDLAHVQRTAVKFVRNAVAVAGDDPRAFTWLDDRRTALVVLDRNGTGYVAAVQVVGNRLTYQAWQVEYGDDVRGVRTIELPDGRVVLVTGEDASFLPLPR